MLNVPDDDINEEDEWSKVAHLGKEFDFLLINFHTTQCLHHIFYEYRLVQEQSTRSRNQANSRCVVRQNNIRSFDMADEDGNSDSHSNDNEGKKIAE